MDALSRHLFETAIAQARVMEPGKREHDPALCIICQNEPHGDEDDTCGSRTCREAWFDDFWERR
jgi:hypothetical protein